MFHSTTPTQALYLIKWVRLRPLYFGFDQLCKIKQSIFFCIRMHRSMNTKMQTGRVKDEDALHANSVEVVLFKGGYAVASLALTKSSRRTYIHTRKPAEQMYERLCTAASVTLLASFNSLFHLQYLSSSLYNSLTPASQKAFDQPESCVCVRVGLKHISTAGLAPLRTRKCTRPDPAAACSRVTT